MIFFFLQVEMVLPSLERLQQGVKVDLIDGELTIHPLFITQN